MEEQWLKKGANKSQQPRKQRRNRINEELCHSKRKEEKMNEVKIERFQTKKEPSFPPAKKEEEEEKEQRAAMLQKNGY